MSETSGIPDASNFKRHRSSITPIISAAVLARWGLPKVERLELPQLWVWEAQKPESPIGHLTVRESGRCLHQLTSLAVNELPIEDVCVSGGHLHRQT
eukprot:Transcript_31676.p2 GENE.Transcript_31676~~Transcript_31676.p2  ORF type:complete len:97 (+),score=1.56 Transcript_31676:634-924(+)